MAAVAHAPRSRFREMAHGNRSPTSSVASLFSGTSSLTRTETRRDQREQDLDHIMAEFLQETLLSPRFQRGGPQGVCHQLLCLLG
eukprot:s2232_g6.t1